MTAATAEHYTIISADCHAGGSHKQYREYLDPRYLDDFDAWRGKYKNPFRDLGDTRRYRNWDNEMRNGQQEADGIVGEVVFPNTVPPFFPSFVLFAQPPKPDEYDHRLAGIRAHNRWLVDWCGEFPERRAGIGQIFLNDIDDALEDVRFIKENGLRGGILLPNVSPDVTWVKPLYDPIYDRLWAEIEELGLPVNVHGGTGVPELRALPGVDAALHQRGALLLAAPAGAVHPLRHLRAVPPHEVRGHRERVRLGAAAPQAPGPGARPHPQDRAPPARSATATSTCCRSRPPSTSTRTCGWASASPAPPTPPPATRSGSTSSCGAATTRTTRAPSRSPASTCGRCSTTPTPPSCSGCSPATPPSSTSSTWRRCQPLAEKYGPTVDELEVPLTEMPPEPNEALLNSVGDWL